MFILLSDCPGLLVSIYAYAKDVVAFNHGVINYQHEAAIIIITQIILEYRIPTSPVRIISIPVYDRFVIDHWQKEKNPQDYHRFFDEWNEKDISAMVLRDRNHPSVIMWSIGNEIQERSDDAGIEIAERLRNIVKKLIGENFYSNVNCVILDGAKVTFGDNVFVAPNCGFYTAGHALDAEQRIQGLEYAYPITIGNNVWIGAQVCVLPGVTIGDNTIIGAGSVVTKSIPANVLAVGNPCRVLRTITEADRAKYISE